MIQDFVSAVPQAFIDEMVGLVGAIALALLFYWFRPRTKLIYGRANNSRNLVFTPETPEGSPGSAHEIYVEKLFIQNIGRVRATNVEFVLNQAPTDIRFFPSSDIHVKTVGHGELLAVIPQIVPGELVVIDCLYINQQASWISSVKCAEALGTQVPFYTTRQFGRVTEIVALLLMFGGAAFLISLLVQLFL